MIVVQRDEVTYANEDTRHDNSSKSRIEYARGTCTSVLGS
jgi:hypothetical protein